MVPDCRAKANRRAALHKGAFHHQLVMENHSKFIEERTKSFKSKCFELLAFLDKALFKKKNIRPGLNLIWNVQLPTLQLFLTYIYILQLGKYDKEAIL